MSRATEIAKELFGGIKETAQALAPGLKDIVPQVGAELSRLGRQGAAELAQALFSGGNTYVPYGSGQRSASDHDHQPEHTPTDGPSRDDHGRDGMSR